MRTNLECTAYFRGIDGKGTCDDRCQWWRGGYCVCTKEDELSEAIRNFLYEFGKSLGIIWLIKKIPFLKLKDWVEEREEGGSK